MSDSEIWNDHADLSDKEELEWALYSQVHFEHNDSIPATPTIFNTYVTDDKSKCELGASPTLKKLDQSSQVLSESKKVNPKNDKKLKRMKEKSIKISSFLEPSESREKGAENLNSKSHKKTSTSTLLDTDKKQSGKSVGNNENCLSSSTVDQPQINSKKKKEASSKKNRKDFTTPCRERKMSEGGLDDKLNNLSNKKINRVKVEYEDKTNKKNIDTDKNINNRVTKRKHKYYSSDSSILSLSEDEDKSKNLITNVMESINKSGILKKKDRSSVSSAEGEAKLSHTEVNTKESGNVVENASDNKDISDSVRKTKNRCNYCRKRGHKTPDCPNYLSNVSENAKKPNKKKENDKYVSSRSSPVPKQIEDKTRAKSEKSQQLKKKSTTNRESHTDVEKEDNQSSEYLSTVQKSPKSESDSAETVKNEADTKNEESSETTDQENLLEQRLKNWQMNPYRNRTSQKIFIPLYLQNICDSYNVPPKEMNTFGTYSSHADLWCDYTLPETSWSNEAASNQNNNQTRKRNKNRNRNKRWNSGRGREKKQNHHRNENHRQ